MKIEPTNVQAKKELAAINEAISREAAADGHAAGDQIGFASIFKDSNWLQKLAQNSKTSGYLADQEFMEKLVRCSKDPSSLNQELRDPRMMQVIAVLIGLNIEMSGGDSRPPNSEDTPVSHI